MTKTLKTYFIYHDKCMDGFGSAWAAWRKFGNQGVYMGGSYDQDPHELVESIPWGAQIYLLDFSFKRDDIVKIREGRPVFVIYHHKSAEEELKGLPDCIFDMDKSGCVLTWLYFHDNQQVPQLLQYIQDRDLWRFNLHNSREVSAALQSYAFNFKTWDHINSTFSRLYGEGLDILRHIGKAVNRICDQSYIGSIGAEKMPIVNSSAYQSEVCEELLRRYPEHPCVAMYYVTKDRRKTWSLRSRGSFDASVIAKKYGGGGHRNAAGFTEEVRN